VGITHLVVLFVVQINYMYKCYVSTRHVTQPYICRLVGTTGEYDWMHVVLTKSKLEMRGKAKSIARSAPHCRRLASSSKAKQNHAAIRRTCSMHSSQRMQVVSVCLHYGNIIWLPWQRPLTNWKIRYRFIICT